MEQRPLEYTVKIYCEGFTEWYYFEWLRTNNRFKFSMEPDIPKNSRSSYKQNLKLIDKELRKNPQERADAIFLVIDTDTLVKNKAQYAIYQEAKEKYKKQGVIFIESHPCIEIWFLYHLIDKFARTNFETYEALRPAIENVLPKYEKTARYYQKASHKSLTIMHNENMICTLKYTGTILKCIFVDGQTFDVDDTKPLDIADAIIGYIALFVRTFAITNR